MGVRLLFVLPEYGSEVRGGIATYYSHLLPALVSLGARVHVCAPSGGRGSTSHDSNGVTFIPVDDNILASANAKFSRLIPLALAEVCHMIAFAYAAWETCARGDGFDVVETTDYGLTFTPWLAAAGDPPVIVQLHGSSGQVYHHDPILGHELSGLVTRLFEDALLGRADELQSYGMPNAMEWSGRLNRSVEHIWPVWRHDGVACTPPPTDLDLPHCGLTIGRIQNWKGPDILCQACALLGARAPTIFWVGRDNRYRANLSMAAHLAAAYPDQWGSTVRPIGEFPRESVAGMLNAAKFVVVPSKWDTFNLAAVEAMWAGKTVICSEGAGAAGLIEHGKNGFRFPAGDAARLADLIETIAAMKPNELETIGARARATVENTLATAEVPIMRLKHYTKIAARGAGRKTNMWDDKLDISDNRSSEFAFLEHLPYRPLLAHVIKRTWSKVRKALG
jgi:glycosyltransferase involved in cell wall biosynthesis